MISIVLLSSNKKHISTAMEFANYMAPKAKITSIIYPKGNKKESCDTRIRKMIKKAMEKKNLIFLVDIDSLNDIDVSKFQSESVDNKIPMIVCSLVESASVAALEAQCGSDTEHIIEAISKSKTII